MIHELAKSKIHFHADKNVDGSKESNDSYVSQIETALGRYSEVITHLEARLSNDDAANKGVNTKKCALEVKAENRKPIAVSHYADTYEEAVAGALDLLTAALDDQG